LTNKVAAGELEVGLSPVDGGIMPFEPIVAEDEVIVTQIRDKKADDFGVVSVSFHSEIDTVCDFSVDILGIVGIAYSNRVCSWTVCRL